MTTSRKVGKMCTFVLRLAAVAVLLLSAWACTDSLTEPVVAPAVVSGPSSDEVVQGCVKADGTGDCTLPPISGGWCEPGDDLCDDGGGDCMTSEPPMGDPGSLGVEGCDEPAPGPGTGGPEPGAGGNGSGGGTPPPPPPNEPGDTCNTGDPVVDSPGVESGFSALWAASNPDQPMENRHERGGWIVADGAGGYAILPFTVVASNACEIVVDLANRPGNAVAFVHTHLYESGVPMRVCQGQTVAGMTVYQTYTNEPSDFDGEAARILGLPGYIIDYDKITKYDYDPTVAWKTTIVDQNARCGY